MRDRGRALLRGKGFSAFVTQAARVTQVEMVTGRKSVPVRAIARSDTWRFYSIARARARASCVRFFISYFFITCPRECVGGTEKVLSRPFTDRPTPSRTRTRLGSRNPDDENVVVRNRTIASPYGGNARVPVGESRFRGPSKPVENFSAPPTAKGVSILFAVKQYYVVKFIALPRLALGPARPYNAPARSPYATTRG